MEKLRIPLLRVHAIPLQRLATLRDSFHPRGSFSGFLLVADEHLRTGDASNCQSVWETLPQTSPSQLRSLWYQGPLELLRREMACVFSFSKEQVTFLNLKEHVPASLIPMTQGVVEKRNFLLKPRDTHRSASA